VFTPPTPTRPDKTVLSGRSRWCEMGFRCTQLHPLPRGTAAPNLDRCLLWSNGWIDQDGTWYEGRPRPRPHCVTWGPSSPAQKGAQPLFWAMSIVAKRSPISAIAEHLLRLDCVPVKFCLPPMTRQLSFSIAGNAL